MHRVNNSVVHCIICMVLSVSLHILLQFCTLQQLSLLSCGYAQLMHDLRTRWPVFPVKSAIKSSHQMLLFQNLYAFWTTLCKALCPTNAATFLDAGRSHALHHWGFFYHHVQYLYIHLFIAVEAHTLKALRWVHVALFSRSRKYAANNSMYFILHVIS